MPLEALAQTSTGIAIGKIPVRILKKRRQNSRFRLAFAIWNQFLTPARSQKLLFSHGPGIGNEKAGD